MLMVRRPMALPASAAAGVLASSTLLLVRRRIA
jgi:hypothetical protein